MIHVIIVDDELLAGVGIQSLIDGKEGIQVDGVFAGPEEAIPFLRENQIDIVITDIEMAQMNGLDFIQAIRESGLADGVIILSCHDDFSYAQEAISKGTDSYLLKHKISGPVLIEEVKKVYLKTHKENRESDADFGGKGFSWDSMKEEVYTVCVLLFYSADGSDDVKEDQVRGKMMYHLIEQIVSRYQLGTVIQPYDRSPFLLFRQDPDKPEKERKTEIISGLSILLKHIRQYYSRKVTAGLSNEFTELSSMREQYEKAASAAEKYFYEPEKEFFFYHAPIREFQNPEFSSEGFLEENGISVFAEELKYCLKQASFCAVSLENIRARLVQSVSRMLFRVLDRNPYLQNFQGKKELDARILSAIIHAGDAKELQFVQSFLRYACAFQILETDRLVKETEDLLGIFIIDIHHQVGIFNIVDPGHMLVPDSLDPVGAEAVLQQGRTLQSFTYAQFCPGEDILDPVSGRHGARGA